jgi:hypothetical protein
MVDGKEYFVIYYEEHHKERPYDLNTWSHYFRVDCNGNIWVKVYEPNEPEILFFPDFWRRPVGYKWCGETSFDVRCFTILDKSETVIVPAGTFTDCIKTYQENWYPESPPKTVTGNEWICKGVGSVKETEDDPEEGHPTTDQLTSAEICEVSYP